MLSSQSTTITVNLLLLSILCIQTYIASGQQHHPRQLRKRQKDDGKRKFHLQQNGLIKDVMNDLHMNAKKIQSPSSSSKDIPPLEDTSEFATLSMTVYDYHIQGLTSCSDSIALPKNVTCQYYEHNEKEGTEVLIVTSAEKKYIAVVFAGTDDNQSTIIDTEFIKETFGPLPNNNKLEKYTDLYVHSGFNNGVFGNGIFDRVLAKITELKKDHPDYRIFLTGHSLGAASSLLTAFGLSQYPNFAKEHITVVNFGCPRVGNYQWRDLVDSSPNLTIWRFVYERDLVARVPPTFLLYHHVGHLAQMEEDGMLAYYRQNRDKKLNYAGAPMGWDIWPIVWIPGGVEKHDLKNYLDYLENKSMHDSNKYYIHDYEKLKKEDLSDDDDDNFEGDDRWIRNNRKRAKIA
mmetsp:Transcript_16232/g.23826  ORF Transcript_16232/g.23826 Transcript_16232/m.23826 type:complete len:403 (-) Transcript_16232:43-1251(-)